MTVRRVLRIVLVTLASILIVGYLGIVAYFMTIEASLVYPPSKRTMPIAEALQPYVETVTFTPQGQQPLSGLIVRAPKPTPRWLYFLHGNIGNVTTCQPWQQLAQQIGVNIFVLDYRGFGQSSGTPSEAGIYQDAQAGYRYLTETRHVSPSGLILYGHSLGAAVALDLATRAPAAGVVLEGAFLSLPTRGQELYWFLPVSMIMRNRFDSLERIDRVPLPKLIMHAASDRVVPIRHGRTLFERAAQPKTFVELQGGHADAVTVDLQTASKALGTFLDRTIRSAQVARH